MSEIVGVLVAMIFNEIQLASHTSPFLSNIWQPK